MSHTIGKWVRFRIALVVIGLILLGTWICGRFFYLQMIKGPQLREMATREYQKFCPILPVRGMITDRKGLELAISTRVSSVVAHPLQIKHAHRLSRELALILGYKPKELKEILTRATSFVWVKRHLTPEREAAFQAWTAEADRKARAAKITGKRDTDAIYLIPEAKRYYPQLSLAGQVLGFCNIDGQGLEGIEHEFDKQLYGKPKQCWKTMDARGRIITSGEKAWDPEVMGNNVVLTLDRTLQYIAEKELAKGVEKYHAAGGTALVVQPQTGEILAMAQSPTMDPNRYGQFSENARRNRLVTDCLEPGSTYKIFVVASALDANVVKPGDRYHCENGVWHVGSKEVIHDVHPYGTLTVQQVIQKSSNIGAAKIANKLGAARLDHYLREFGFGSKSGIAFNGESSGLLRNLAKAHSVIDRVTVAFGQGVSVTPLQLTMALASMGNGGVLMEPHIVKEIMDPRGHKVQESAPRPVRRVMSERAAHEMLAIMETVTQQGGTAKEAAVPGFTVAGKTGTAQKLVGHAYSHNKFSALFVGLVPADKPVLAVSVIIDEPKGAIFGGVVAAPIFKEIAAQSLRVLGYYPKPEVDKNTPVLVKGGTPAKGGKTGKEAPPPVLAASPTLAQLLPFKVKAPKEPPKVMPDLKGCTIRQVLELLNRTGLKCRLEGSGLAVAQEPPPGTAITPGATCSVKFQSSS
ncbi:MAG: penicillin-binding transpeptidase domain-containing protein [Deltaproteobacteria bacterium]|nr:penicillin-binding transpeptidase domain-containing protein [Deltaproteobacteria bacterium]